MPSPLEWKTSAGFLCCRGVLQRVRSRYLQENDGMPWSLLPELAAESCCPSLQTPGKGLSPRSGTVLLACRFICWLADRVNLLHHSQTEIFVPPNSQEEGWYTSTKTLTVLVARSTRMTKTTGQQQKKNLTQLPPHERKYTRHTHARAQGFTA